MTDQFKNVVIGLFVLAASVIVIFLLLFLHPSTGNKGEILYVRFADIDKVNVGTRVTFAGKPVGEVTAIREVEYDRQGPKDPNDHIYVYELTLAIDSGMKIYNTDEFTLRTSGLLGERSVAIIPLAAKEGQQPVLLTDKDVIYATQVGSVEETMKEFKEVADKLEKALDNVTAILEDVQNEQIVRKISQTIDNVKEITDAVNKPEQLASIIDNIHDFTTQLTKRLPHSWDMLDKSLDHLQDTTSNTKILVSDIRAGKGSAGKILVSDDLYLRLTSILNKGETVMNDINHYGVLYNLDKGWQRLRARRANLLLKLSNPQQFRNFFNDELDQVQTALARVSMVLDNSANYYPGCPLSNNPEFAKVYAELLRRVEGIESSLKMYDSQLMESKVAETELLQPNSCECWQ